MMTNLIFILVLLCTNILIAEAKNNRHIIRDTTIVYFQQGMSSLDLKYSDNKKRLDVLVRSLNSCIERDEIALHINVIASTSPEGNVENNLRLSERRADAVASFVKSQTHIADSLLSYKGIGTNWTIMERFIKSSNVQHKKDILYILQETPEQVCTNGITANEKLRQLKRMNGGRTYSWLYNHSFDLMRSAEIIMEYTPSTKIIAPEARHNIPRNVDENQLYGYINSLPYQSSDWRRKNLYVSVKTNLVYDLGIIPSIGGEIYLGKQWSVSGYFNYAWWKSDRLHWYWRTYGGELSVRKWLGRRAIEKPLTGHHLGLYGQMFTYDFETGGKGVLADDINYAFGVEYGYSLPIARRLNIDFVIGVGYMGGEYKEYIPTEHCYAWIATKRRHWFGPTKAEIALVWLIGHHNTNKSKGNKP